MIFADAKIHAKKFPFRYYRFGLGPKLGCFGPSALCRKIFSEALMCRTFSLLPENVF